MSGFSFNAPSSTGGSGGGLFGSKTTPTTTGGSLFGNLGGTSSGASTPSLFGTANTSSAQSHPFGAKTTGAESGSSTPTFSFGAAQGQNKPASPFGGLSQTPNKTTEAPAPSQTQTAGGLFGAKPGGGGGGGLFGSNTPAQTKPATSLFSTTPANPPPGGGTTGSAPSLFGAQPSQKSLPPATTTESVATSQPQASNLFGQNTAAADKPLFGTAPSSTSANTLFGAANKAPATSDSGSKPLFGAPPTTAQPSSGLFKLGGPNAGGNAPASPFGAAAAPAPSTQPSTTAAPEATPQKSLFNIGGTSSTTPSSTPAAAPSLFTGIGKPASTAATSTPATTAAAATAPSGGLFGAKPAATATATTTTTATPATTATAGATTTAAAASAAPNAPKAPTPNLGASTFGPTPPAQSRLKNKTMDEIITRWATDLTKYQKEFKEQAEKVAEWDRMLVVNSAKVQKLYGNTVDAERATQEVERQLASVEGQQEELNAWLDRYEREVDEMLAKQVGPGETLQGPDQERERTYKLAEKLSERLDEMGKDLGSMIEEINNASSTLSKTNKTDEPISQIVRILNSHLSQLQMIDQGTAELQAKVSAAQKSGQSLGSRLGGYGHNGASVGEGLSAADDFYRSYMGRR